MIESAAEFVRLRTSEDPTDYSRAARDEAPDQVWLEVIEHYPDMRGWVAHNKTAPLLILRLLAVDESAEVRCTVAGRRRIDLDLFRLLAVDTAYGVRAGVLQNPKVPIEILEHLASEDPSDWIRDQAAARLALRARDL